MRRGQIVERCATAAVFDNPQQGYTGQLIDAIPHLPGGAAKPTGPARERVTKAESEVPLCVERNFDNLPFETAADLANGAGVSEMTVSRFLRRLGYAHEAVKIADMCLRRNIPPILVNDRYSIWPRQYTPHMLSVATLRRILTRFRMNPAARCARSRPPTERMTVYDPSCARPRHRGAVPRHARPF
jgi:ABC-type glutathione transport system ATPase component|tara:strand:+ start:652 stop:1209 length:558 start_codon:yes stop_codon:yes gene_type:complete